MNSRLQVVANPVTVGVPEEARREDHRRLVEAYIKSRWLRNLAEKSNERIRRGLDTFFASVGKYAWEVTEADVAAWHGDLVEAGLTAATRRSYVGFVRTFYDYLKDHPFVPLSANELRAGVQPVALQVRYGREVVQPVSPWVALVYTTRDASNHRHLPAKEGTAGILRVASPTSWIVQKAATAGPGLRLVSHAVPHGFEGQRGSQSDHPRYPPGIPHGSCADGQRNQGFRPAYPLGSHAVRNRDGASHLPQGGPAEVGRGRCPQH